MPHRPQFLSPWRGFKGLGRGEVNQPAKNASAAIYGGNSWTISQGRFIGDFLNIAFEQTQKTPLLRAGFFEISCRYEGKSFDPRFSKHLVDRIVSAR